MGFFDLFKQADINQGIKEFKSVPGAVLLDVRTVQENQEGHIPGSVNVPLQDLGRSGDLPAGRATPLFIYCHSGARGRQAAELLARMGYTGVKNIGGMAAYTGKVER